MENQSFRQPEHIPEIPRPHYRPPYNPYMPPPPSNSTNTMGILGFIFSLLSLFIGFIPIFGWIIWVLGLVFSCIGLGRRPRALAVAGLIISVAVVAMLVVFAAIFGEAFSEAMDAFNTSVSDFD